MKGISVFFIGAEDVLRSSFFTVWDPKKPAPPKGGAGDSEYGLTSQASEVKPYESNQTGQARCG